jgi:hypothetical protein
VAGGLVPCGVVPGGLLPGGFVPGGFVPAGTVVEPGLPGLEVGGASVPDGPEPGDVVGAGAGALVVVLLLPPEPEPPDPEPPDPEPPEPRLPEPEPPEVEPARSVVHVADEAVVVFVDDVPRRLAVESLATVVVVVGGSVVVVGSTIWATPAGTGARATAPSAMSIINPTTSPRRRGT